MGGGQLSQALRQLQTDRYMDFSACTWWIYDFLLGMSDDVKILSSSSPTLPIISYFISRSVTLLYVLLTLVARGISPDSCLYSTLLTITGWLVPIGIPCDAFIFFLRVRALYFPSRTIMIIFGALWMLTLTTFVSPFAYKLKTTHNEDGTCTISASFNHTLGNLPLLLLLAFDTAVVVAVSIRVMRYSGTDQSWKSKIRLLLFGEYLGHTPRVFLRTGQIYYFATVGAQATVAALVGSPTLSPSLRGSIALFDVIFQNIMACRVFRTLKMDGAESSGKSTLASAGHTGAQQSALYFTQSMATSTTMPESLTGLELDLPPNVQSRT